MKVILEVLGRLTPTWLLLAFSLGVIGGVVFATYLFE